MSFSPHGSSVGPPGLGSSIGEFEIWLTGDLGRECLSVGALLREPGGRALLLGTLKDMQKKGLETRISFHRGPIWGTWRRAHLPGTLRDGYRGLCG